MVLTEESVFKDGVREILKVSSIEGQDHTNKLHFEKFYGLLSKKTSSTQKERVLYKIKFIDLNGEEAEKFSLRKLINIKEIKANRHLNEGVLTKVFSKIVSFQFDSDTASRSGLEASIESMNKQITGNVNAKSDDISQVLAEIENTQKVDLNLSGNVSYEAIIKGLIKYNFVDGDDYIPEDQFGLGYINLLNIIGEIIHFVDSYEDKSHFNRINLINYKVVKDKKGA